jgi:hypothetical protein
MAHRERTQYAKKHSPSYYNPRDFSDAFSPIRKVSESAHEKTRAMQDNLEKASNSIKMLGTPEDIIIDEASRQIDIALQSLKNTASNEEKQIELRNSAMHAFHNASERAFAVYKSENASDATDEAIFSANVHANKSLVKSIAAHANAKLLEETAHRNREHARTSVESALIATRAINRLVPNERSMMEVENILNNVYEPMKLMEPTHGCTVERECNFLDQPIMLQDITKPLPNDVNEIGCYGFAATVHNGRTTLSRVECQPLSNGKCPTLYDPGRCTLRTYDLNVLLPERSSFE